MLEKLPLVNTSNIMVLGVKNKRKLTPQQKTKVIRKKAYGLRDCNNRKNLKAY